MREHETAFFGAGPGGFLVHWSIDGVEAWGDDQDARPLHQSSAFRRGQMALRDQRADRVGDVWT